jgi:hypothetical protein
VVASRLAAHHAKLAALIFARVSSLTFLRAFDALTLALQLSETGGPQQRLSNAQLV